MPFPLPTGTEYTLSDGTSYVYNLGEQITPDEDENMDWQNMHTKHVVDKKIDCASCHTAPPKELTSTRSSLCASCHDYESESDPQKIHDKHVKKNIACTTCHTF